MIGTNALKAARTRAGLSLRQLSERSGVAIDTLSRLENNQRNPQVGTLNKVAVALGVPVEPLAEALMKEEKTLDEQVTTEEKVEVTVVRRDREDRQLGETLRFRGEEIDSYEHNDVTRTLYECPDGYRVFVEDIDNDTSELYPRATWGNADYITYRSPEALVQDFPWFGGTVGVYPVRDLD